MSRDQRPSTNGTGEGLTDSLYAHPLIRQLEGRTLTQRSRLSSIPKTDFARALIDIVAPSDTQPASVERVREQVQEWDKDNPMRAPLLTLTAEAEGQLSRLRDGVSDWFDARMDLLSAAYRRHVKWLLLGIAIVVTLVFNVDSIRAAKALYDDEALRAAVAERAIGLTAQCESKSGDELAACIREEVDKVTASLTLPVGWREDVDVDGWQVLGWAIAVVALSQGGPFWFDALRKASGLKGSGVSKPSG